jgi:hypothetical protein
VLTVSTEVPAPFATEAGLKAHVGTRLTTGATLHVKATALLKLVPGAGAMVTVEVEDAPAATVAGASAVAAMVKSAAGAVTVRAPGVE